MIKDNIGAPYEKCEETGCEKDGIWWTDDGQHCFCDKHNFNLEVKTK